MQQRFLIGVACAFLFAYAVLNMRDDAERSAPDVAVDSSEASRSRDGLAKHYALKDAREAEPGRDQDFHRFEIVGSGAPAIRSEPTINSLKIGHTINLLGDTVDMYIGVEEGELYFSRKKRTD